MRSVCSASRRVFPSVSFLARNVRAGSCVRPWTTAIRCSAQLSWRLPPRSRRWRLFFPEDAGIGVTPARRASLASVLKRCTPCGLGEDLRGGQRPATGEFQELWRL